MYTKPVADRMRTRSGAIMQLHVSSSSETSPTFGNTERFPLHDQMSGWLRHCLADTLSWSYTLEIIFLSRLQYI